MLLSEGQRFMPKKTNHSETKQLVLVLGAQKCGTSWMWEFLRSLPQYRPGFMKEYHVFDSIHMKAFANYRRGILSAASKSMLADMDSMSTDQRNAILRHNFCVNPSSYFDYMAGLLRGPGPSLTSDASPTYMALPASVLEHIGSECESRGIEVKPILLLREPVARWLSDVRFSLQRRRVKYSPEAERVWMERAGGQKNRYLRAVSDYEGAVTRVRSVFGDNLLCLIYEEFFSTKSTKTVCEFLGVDEFPGEFEQIRNQSKYVNAQNKTKPKDYLAFRDMFLSQYQFSLNYFGEDRIRSAWGDMVP